MSDFSVHFIIPGPPRGKGRPRFSNGKAYTDEKTKAYEEVIAWQFMCAQRRWQLTPDQWERVKKAQVSVVIIASYEVPKSDSKKVRLEKLENRQRPTKKPDIDNVCKAVLDGLNRLAYEDDTQVYHLHAIKRYDETPRVEVSVIYDNCL